MEMAETLIDSLHCPIFSICTVNPNGMGIIE
jgi:hypothetical protein